MDKPFDKDEQQAAFDRLKSLMSKLSSLKRSGMSGPWDAGIAYEKRDEPLYTLYEKRDPLNDFNAQQLSDYMQLLRQVFISSRDAHAIWLITLLVWIICLIIWAIILIVWAITFRNRFTYY